MDKDIKLDTAFADVDSDFVKALSESTRIEILKQLSFHGPMDVKSLAHKMPQDRSVISRHLALMEKAGILKAHKEGRHVIYRVDGQRLLQKSEKLVETLRTCVSLGCC